MFFYDILTNPKHLKNYFVRQSLPGDLFLGIFFKDSHRENTPSNKTQALSKIIIMGIWVISTLNQLFIRCSYNQIKFSKKKVVGGRTPFFVIGIFCTSHSNCLNIGF